MCNETTRIRFWEKVRIVPGIPCWIWVGSTVRNGYGQFRNGGRKIYAHRYFDELVNGPMPSGQEIHHVCGSGPV